MHKYCSVLMTLCCVTGIVEGQRPRSVRPCSGGAVTLALPGGVVEENRRAEDIRGGRALAGWRTQSLDARARMLADSAEAPIRFALVVPEVMVNSHRTFPVPSNDGPMWSGRGVSYSVTGGVAICGKSARWGAIIAPTYWYAENAHYDLPNNTEYVPPLQDGYSPFASPYFYAPRSLDQPRRFGSEPLRHLDPGVLSVWYRAPRVEFGFTTESEWWGPGQYNALLQSAHAAGVPRAYVKTSRSIDAAGSLDAQWFLGALSYSDFFRDPEVPFAPRSLSGLALTWRPRVEPNLLIGVSRIVASPRAGNDWFRRLADPVLGTGRPNAFSRLDSLSVLGRDQLFGVFANWRLPSDGTDLWMEWARAELPASLRDFVESPNHSQALTIGLMHEQPFARRELRWRLTAEYSQTNQSSSYRERPTGSWYTSRAVPGGFTQRGQVIGAAIGPGSVSQRFGFDVSHRRGSLGVFVSRVKWDDDTYYTLPRPARVDFCKHDVSLAWGARGAMLTRAGWFESTVTTQNRLNTYWQALGFCFDNAELQIDKRNLSIEFRFRPQVHQRSSER